MPRTSAGVPQPFQSAPQPETRAKVTTMSKECIWVGQSQFGLSVAHEWSKGSRLWGTWTQWSQDWSGTLSGSTVPSIGILQLVLLQELLTSVVRVLVLGAKEAHLVETEIAQTRSLDFYSSNLKPNLLPIRQCWSLSRRNSSSQLILAHRLSITAPPSTKVMAGSTYWGKT